MFCLRQSYIIDKFENNELVDEPDGYSLTPLMHVCASGNYQIFKFFVKHNLVSKCMNLQTHGMRCTALHFAYESGNKKIIDCLLENGAAVSFLYSHADGQFFFLW